MKLLLASLTLLVALDAARSYATSDKGGNRCKIFLPDHRIFCQGRCGFGAECSINLGGRPQCLCDLLTFCNATLPTERTICATDWNAYRHPCEIKFQACRMQKDIKMVDPLRCSIIPLQPDDPDAPFAV